jgi:Cof subfamily protein (haloacid dehalogenase superfamily)
MSQPKCRLLAVDVDGTLVKAGQIAPADADALRAAASAGVLVCLCTGRSWDEVKPVWAELALPEPLAPVICVGGALVVEPQTGRTLYSRSFDRPTACELSGVMRQLGYPVMALVDAWREGFDYMMVGTFGERAMYQRFFNGRGHRVQFVPHLDPTDSPRTLRISVLEEPHLADGVLKQVLGQFGDRVEGQAIFAPNYGVHIVETFTRGANKFSALVYVGQGYRIAPPAMAAIGDDYNDVPMLKNAGFSAAPADANPTVLAAAKTIVAPRGQTPVAQFVASLLQ